MDEECWPGRAPPFFLATTAPSAEPLFFFEEPPREPPSAPAPPSSRCAFSPAAAETERRLLRVSRGFSPPPSPPPEAEPPRRLRLPPDEEAESASADLRRRLRTVPAPVLRSMEPPFTSRSASSGLSLNILPPIMASVLSWRSSSLMRSKASSPIWQGRRRSPSLGSLPPVSIASSGTTRRDPSSMRRVRRSRGMSNSTTLPVPAGVSMTAFFFGARCLKSL